MNRNSRVRPVLSRAVAIVLAVAWCALCILAALASTGMFA